MSGDRWFRFERDDRDALVLIRRGDRLTGNRDLELWRDEGTIYGVGYDGGAGLLADLLALLPVEHARTAVRAYLARDPEAAAKVAGPWVEVHRGYRSVRMLPGAAYSIDGRNLRDVVAESCGVRERKAIAWALPKAPAVEGATRAEAEAAVDALLVGDGWVLGVGDGR